MRCKIGIRREDINRWEKRVPLAPEDVRDLGAKYPLDFIVQPSDIRAFNDDEYRAAGAAVAEDICPSRVVLALKEIPVELIRSGKVYVFFSHTIKGQEHNMPMLRKMMELGCTVIDYERMVDEQNRRVIYFGNYAGHAGMLDTLWALGRRLALEGIRNPFTSLGETVEYSGLEALKDAVREVGKRIVKEGLPESVRPLTIGFFGYGHVSQGAQEILELLPLETVAPADLSGLAAKGSSVPGRVFKTVFKEEDMVVARSGNGRFDLQDYYRNPDKYRPVVENYVPYLTVIVNGIYWTDKYPRYVTKSFLKGLYGGPVRPKLRVIGDITCDINGSIESTIEATDSENPVYVYDPKRDLALKGFEGNGPVVMSVYNLPAELPAESSRHFSSVLKRFVPEIASADYGRDLAACGLPDVVRRAVIVYNGRLTPEYEYLKPYLART